MTALVPAACARVPSGRSSAQPPRRAPPGTAGGTGWRPGRRGSAPAGSGPDPGSTDPPKGRRAPDGPNWAHPEGRCWLAVASLVWSHPLRLSPRDDPYSIKSRAGVLMHAIPGVMKQCEAPGPRVGKRRTLARPRKGSGPSYSSAGRVSVTRRPGALSESTSLPSCSNPWRPAPSSRRPPRRSRTRSP